ncbi:hypothetical protein BO85DRAFT_48494 [Aspergillus piperis CBS 112811]|uniref:Uncharacterized protein n=1 Tax=Aspergillus piperis CBS 112811 TaxID=1448313 RepID=A0A8G1VKA4_9EURO|nr:hypothetical protein BO85DRAFT_48494 [Aspergillus piperis CBS 112811]RAH56346.1 hypothetical protein BO85DRAFT_48494 [Aspergillus piperis CBS 112811]
MVNHSFTVVIALSTSSHTDCRVPTPTGLPSIGSPLRHRPSGLAAPRHIPAPAWPGPSHCVLAIASRIHIHSLVAAASRLAQVN